MACELRKEAICGPLPSEQEEAGGAEGDGGVLGSAVVLRAAATRCDGPDQGALF